jgi:hypothetical protein
MREVLGQVRHDDQDTKVPVVGVRSVILMMTMLRVMRVTGLWVTMNSEGKYSCFQSHVGYIGLRQACRRSASSITSKARMLEGVAP